MLRAIKASRVWIFVLAVVPALVGADQRSSLLPVQARHAMVVSQRDLASKIGADVLDRGGPSSMRRWPRRSPWPSSIPQLATSGVEGFSCIVRQRRIRSRTTFVRWRRPERRRRCSSGTGGTLQSCTMVAIWPSVYRERWLVCITRGREHGRLPWVQLVEPAVALARDGFVVTDGLARSLEGVLDDMRRHPVSLAQFSKDGKPYEAGDMLRQPDLARTLQRIADSGPAGFYEGETARLVEQAMKANGGLITRDEV